MAKTAVYPGSFDPITAGHLDVIRRAAGIFDEVIVAVMRHPDKQGCFGIEERLKWIRTACEEIKNVRCEAWDGLLVDFLALARVRCVVRGIRGPKDLETESPMAEINGLLLPGTETVFLLSKPEHAHISSSAVRELLSYGATPAGMLPESISADVRRKYDEIMLAGRGG